MTPKNKANELVEKIDEMGLSEKEVFNLNEEE
jgi:hypothetical protein